jgi:hypothetical protein
MAWTYTPGGSKLGDRIMALKPFMLEKGGQKYWNELFTFVTRVIVTGGGVAAGKQFGEIDLSAAGDVTTAVPKNFADPMVFGIPPASLQVRQMPGYSYPTVQVFVFQGFNG